MNITAEDVNAIPEDWAREIADSCDPDGDYNRDGYDPWRIIRENLDEPEVREQVADVLSFIQDMASQESERAKRIDD